MEDLNHSARAGSERFFPSRRFRKRGNPVWISRFLNRTDGGKDPLLSRSQFIQRFPMQESAFYPICCSVSTKRCIPQNMNTKTIGGKGDTGKDEIREALNHSARAGGERFFPAEGSENGGILYGFPVFGTARMGDKIRCPAADELFRGSFIQRSRKSGLRTMCRKENRR